MCSRNGLPSGLRKAMRLAVVGPILAVIAIVSCTQLAAHDHGASKGAAACETGRSMQSSEIGVPAGMVRIRGGRFMMGSDKHHPEERPARVASVGDFFIDRTEVTNEQFADFVKATGYVTLVERPVDPEKYKGAPPDLLKPGSIVFRQPSTVAGMANPTQWWSYTPGATWREPEGPGSSIAGRMSHPVVHVTHADALAYARWKGNDLPTEAEWEFAARGGLDSKEFTWGDEKTPSGKWQANTWQGIFPLSNQIADGYEGTAPVGCYEPNGFGLSDMAGNVWEITADDYRDQRGPQRDMKVAKGGSYLCADNFCYRYRPSGRQPVSTDVGASHIGFRTIRRITAPEATR